MRDREIETPVESRAPVLVGGIELQDGTFLTGPDPRPVSEPSAISLRRLAGGRCVDDHVDRLGDRLGVDAVWAMRFGAARTLPRGIAAREGRPSCPSAIGSVAAALGRGAGISLTPWSPLASALQEG